MAPRSHRTTLSLTTLSLVLLGLSLFTKIVATAWLRRYTPRIQYTYEGDDYPVSWPISRPPVLMASDNSRRFRLNSSDGAAEWSAIIPGDGLVHLGPNRHPFTISMFHQLRCLDVLRAEMVRPHSDDGSTAALARHCLNYIKQMVLCRGDIQLESFHYASSDAPIDLLGLYECRDWGAVYDAVRENQKSSRAEGGK